MQQECNLKAQRESLIRKRICRLTTKRLPCKCEELKSCCDVVNVFSTTTAAEKCGDVRNECQQQSLTSVQCSEVELMKVSGIHDLKHIHFFLFRYPDNADLDCIAVDASNHRRTFFRLASP